MFSLLEVKYIVMKYCLITYPLFIFHQHILEYPAEKDSFHWYNGCKTTLVN